MKRIKGLFAIVLILFSCTPQDEKARLPNIILIMADDLGYGDVAYYGNPVVKTPCLDEMSREAIRFDRFYAAAPVCSPTRASCLTGRHPYRSGIPWAGRYSLPQEEITLAEILAPEGYTTAHFGKWHIGGLSRQVIQSEFPGGPTPYSPPWENGFDECFSTESMMPLFNPYYHVGGPFGTESYRHLQTVPVKTGQQTGGAPWGNYYWTGPGQFVDDFPEGDDSRIIMDRVLDFIDRKVKSGEPFFSVVWFHAPHTPIVAGGEHRSLYPDQPIEAQHWFGSITAMDEQIGRLRKYLKINNIAENTIVWFCSDNGPSYVHRYNSAGPLRGKKAELYEGGIRVPAILEWPAVFPDSAVISIPVSTSDFFLTLLAMVNIENKANQTIDGENILPILLEGKKRQNPIPFISPLPDRLKKQFITVEEQFALVGDRFKLISVDNGISYQLYDLFEDVSEAHDIAAEQPVVTYSMRAILTEWINGCRQDFEKIEKGP